MLTQSQRDALSIAHTEISAIIKDLTERMKAKGYATANADIDIRQDDVLLRLSSGHAKVFRQPWSPGVESYRYISADSIADAVEKASDVIDGMFDLTSPDVDYAGPLILAGGQ